MPQPARAPVRHFLRTRHGRAFVYQALALGALVAAGWLLWHNTADNLAARQIRSGFGFLAQPSGFDIGEALFAYSSRDSYLRAFAVGVANTLRVALAGIVLATVLGTLIGIGRLAQNALLRGLCTAYVEVLRNVPLIIQLFAWYLVLTELLPAATEPLRLGTHFFLSKSGLQFPFPEWSTGWSVALAGVPIGILAAIGYRHWARQRRLRTGVAPPAVWPALLLVLGMPLLGWLVGGAPTDFDVPAVGSFDVTGGAAATPEFLSLLIGLTGFTAAYIAENVRSGVLAVPGGQTEAAAALGLSRGLTLRLVLLPQALRVIVPPLTSQYLNLTKNSSLAVAIGYPDVVSIANTTINQNGQALECVLMIMTVYLAINLVTALLMGWYNRRVAIVER
ncbi:MAG: ABC transporter permease subunit [Betaproteobacteria bacterium]|nr:ABC transporter permease subunit [Betaproteobacteria bacterium]